MSIHVTRKDLAAYIAGNCTKSKISSIESHLALCLECKQRASLLAEAVSSKVTSVEPPLRVKQSVIRSWMEMNASLRSSAIAKRRFSLRPVFAAAVVVSFVAAAAYLFFQNRADEQYALNISALSGIVSSENVSAKKGAIVREGDYIESGVNSSFELSSLVVAVTGNNNTRIKIVSDRKKTGIVISLVAGSIVSRSRGAGGYQYEVMGYRVDPTGTVFSLMRSGNTLTAIVKEGSISITDAALRVSLGAGEKWVSSDTGVTVASSLELSRVFGDASGLTDAAEDARKQSLSEHSRQQSEGNLPENAASELTQPQNRDNGKEMNRDSREMRQERDDLRKEMKRRNGKGE